MPVAEQAALPDARIPSPFRIAARLSPGRAEVPFLWQASYHRRASTFINRLCTSRATRADLGHTDDEISSPSISTSGNGCCRAPGRIAGRVAADLSVAAGAHHRSLSCRPSNGQHCAPHGAIAVGAAWAGIRY